MVSVVSSDYLTDEEYLAYWFRLEGMRRAISESLGITSGMKVLDVGTGWGLVSVEMAKQIQEGEIVGIDIVAEDVKRAVVTAKNVGVFDVI